MFYFMVNLTLFFAPPVLLTAAGAPEIYGQVLGGLLGGLLSLACLLLPLWLVRRRIPMLGEAVS